MEEQQQVYEKVAAAPIKADAFDQMVKVVPVGQFLLSGKICKSENGDLQFNCKVEPFQNQNTDSKDTASKDCLNTKEAAELIHHSPWWLSRKENQIKYSIPVHRSGGKNVFYKTELFEWMEKREGKKRGRPRTHAYLENP